MELGLVIIGIFLAAIPWLFMNKAISSKYESAYAGVLVITFVVGLILVITGLLKKADKNTNIDVEYKVVKIVHYQALNAEEINQVWLKEEDGDYFYIFVNDKEFFELKEENENGDVVMNLSKADFKKIIRSK